MRTLNKQLTPKLEELFWRYAVCKDSDECWVWQGSTNGFYGIIQHPEPRFNVGAHRVSYMIHHGEIKPGLSVLHKCDNPKCVNPSHLFAGTQKQNMVDMVSKGRGVQPNVVGSNNGRAKLSPVDVSEIKYWLSIKRPAKELAIKYGVSTSTISHIKLGKLWKSLQ